MPSADRFLNIPGTRILDGHLHTSVIRMNNVQLGPGESLNYGI